MLIYLLFCCCWIQESDLSVLKPLSLFDFLRTSAKFIQHRIYPVLFWYSSLSPGLLKGLYCLCQNMCQPPDICQAFLASQINYFHSTPAHWRFLYGTFFPFQVEKMSAMETNLTNNAHDAGFTLRPSVQTSSTDLFNFTGNFSRTGGSGTTSSGGVFESQLIIPLYVIIFVLSIVGNSLVLVTLVRNKRMRTVTNVYLLNLVSSTI